MLSGPRLRWGAWTHALGEEAGAGGLQLVRDLYPRGQAGWVGSWGSGRVCLSRSGVSGKTERVPTRGRGPWPPLTPPLTMATGNNSGEGRDSSRGFRGAPPHRAGLGLRCGGGRVEGRTNLAPCPTCPRRRGQDMGSGCSERAVRTATERPGWLPPHAGTPQAWGHTHECLQAPRHSLTPLEASAQHAHTGCPSQGTTVDVCGPVTDTPAPQPSQALPPLPSCPVSSPLASPTISPSEPGDEVRTRPACLRPQHQAQPRETPRTSGWWP